MRPEKSSGLGLRCLFTLSVRNVEVKCVEMEIRRQWLEREVKKLNSHPKECEKWFLEGSVEYGEIDLRIFCLYVFKREES